MIWSHIIFIGYLKTGGGGGGGSSGVGRGDARTPSGSATGLFDFPKTFFMCKGILHSCISSFSQMGLDRVPV